MFCAAGPAVVLLEVQGLSGCVDPVLYAWLGYSPRARAFPPAAAPAAPAAAAQGLAAAVSPLDPRVLQRAALLPVSPGPAGSRGETLTHWLRGSKTERLCLSEPKRFRPRFAEPV